MTGQARSCVCVRVLKRDNYFSSFGFGLTVASEKICGKEYEKCILQEQEECLCHHAHPQKRLHNYNCDSRHFSFAYIATNIKIFIKRHYLNQSEP